MITGGSQLGTGAFGPYELEDTVTEDATSAVYRAYDRLRSRRVRLRVFAVVGAGAGDRLRAWGALRRLGDPWIVPVHASGEIGGRLFLDTEWTDDPDLASVLESEGPLPPERFWSILDQVAGALDAAHGVGVAHGRVQPQHVRIGTAGARLTDFATGAPVPGDARRADLTGLGELLVACLPADAADAIRQRVRASTAPGIRLGLLAAVDLVREVRRTLSPHSVPCLPLPRPATGTGPSWWRPGPETRRHPTAEAVITIGRGVGNVVVIDDLLVSHDHAEVRQDGSGWRVRDLGSWNGTFLNGTRISERSIREHDVIGIGHTLLQFVGGRLVEHTDDGDVTLVARDLRVRTSRGRVLLDGISFALGERSLLAVVGPSGAGKSTLLGALTGFRPATSGSVEYAGRDLYAEYDELRQRIGLVPQDDVLHVQLPVRKALLYAAQLRFPADATAAERDRRVDEVLRQLSLDERVARQRISTLSGGQRKRVNVALELLTRPSMLFLDEPTSGLDPGMRKEVMQTLRELADEGRTVVTVTHDEGSLDVCDRLLVLAKGGRLAFFGAPRDALGYFGQSDFADVFRLLNRDETTDWTARFAASPHAGRYLVHPPAVAQTHGLTEVDPPPAQQPWIVQTATLCRRYLSVIAADRWYTAFLLLMPLVLGLVSRILPGDAGLSMEFGLANPGDASQPGQILLVLVVAGAFAGFASSFRELVKERSIYRRERAIGLSRSAYLTSKVAVLGVISGLQAAGVAAVGMIGIRPPDEALLLGSPVLEVAGAVASVALSMMALGLLVSALIENPDRGMPMLVVVLMIALVMPGGIFPVHEELALNAFSWLVPSRWGLAMSAATAGLMPAPSHDGSPPEELDPLWEHDPAVWTLGLGALATLTVVFLLLTATALRRLEPRRR